MAELQDYLAGEVAEDYARGAADGGRRCGGRNARPRGGGGLGAAGR